jgi:hypothetical protein
MQQEAQELYHTLRVSMFDSGTCPEFQYKQLIEELGPYFMFILETYLPSNDSKRPNG